MGNVCRKPHELQRQDGVTEFAYYDEEFVLGNKLEKCNGLDNKCTNEVEFFPGAKGVGIYCKDCRYKNMDNEWFD